jgi:hypothetical protein
VSRKEDGHSGDEHKDKAQKKIMSMIICIYLKNYNLLAIIYLLYLLTAIGLSPGGITQLHTNNKIEQHK